MAYIPQIKIKDYNYTLPKHRIAQYPLENRDESKLAIYKNNKVSEDYFKNISKYLPDNSLLLYNETKVIQARIKFRKETGTQIEILCLEPIEPTREIQLAFQQKSGVVWKCLVGNSKKWKEGKLFTKFNCKYGEGVLYAERLQQFRKHSYIKLSWTPAEITCSEMLLCSGIIPRPPYMNRGSEESDKYRYQTIYAKSEGSVAAPTAGLHFTDKVFKKLTEKKISIEEVTLHVGAGTFIPVSSSLVTGHEMHTEKIFIQKDTIINILQNLNNNIIVVGTTTMRTIESLYWFGVKQLIDKNQKETIEIKQWDPYELKYNKSISVEESLNKVLEVMNKRNMEVISGQTQLMIVPGYKYKIPNILITNFHMPQSTLLLLVSAFIGESWRDVYKYALGHNFRFLSYGDSCLFFKQ